MCEMRLARGKVTYVNLFSYIQIMHIALKLKIILIIFKIKTMGEKPTTEFRNIRRKGNYEGKNPGEHKFG